MASPAAAAPPAQGGEGAPLGPSAGLFTDMSPVTGVGPDDDTLSPSRAATGGGPALVLFADGPGAEDAVAIVIQRAWRGSAARVRVRRMHAAGQTLARAGTVRRARDECRRRREWVDGQRVYTSWMSFRSRGACLTRAAARGRGGWWTECLRSSV